MLNQLAAGNCNRHISYAGSPVGISAMQRCLVLGLMAFISTVGMSADVIGKAADQPGGLYSNIDLSPETGDLGGFEIEIHADEVQPYVLFADCAGWCNSYYRVPLKLDRDGFEFSYAELTCSEAGSLQLAEPRRMHARVSGEYLILVDREEPGAGRWVLKAAADRFGLEIATPESDARCHRY